MSRSNGMVYHHLSGHTMTKLNSPVVVHTEWGGGQNKRKPLLEINREIFSSLGLWL